MPKPLRGLLACLALSLPAFAMAGYPPLPEALRLTDLNGVRKSSAEERRDVLLENFCSPSVVFALRLVAVDPEFTPAIALSEAKIKRLSDEIWRETAIEATARGRLARLFELRSQLIDSKSVYYVAKNRPTDAGFESTRRAHVEKLRRLVGAMHGEASKLAEEIGYSPSVMIPSLGDDPDFMIQDQAIEKLETRLRELRERRRSALVDCTAAHLIARIDRHEVRTGRVLARLSPAVREKLERNWFRR